MPIYAQASPLLAGLDSVAQFFTAQQQNKLQKAALARQQVQDAQTKAYQQAQIAQMQASQGLQQKQFDVTNKQFNVSHGLDAQGNPLPLPPELAQPPGPTQTTVSKRAPTDVAQDFPMSGNLPQQETKQPTLMDQANYYMRVAAYQAHTGNQTGASFSMQQATTLSQFAAQAQQQALAFQKAADEHAIAQARINHWTASDLERARHDNETIAVAIQNGQLRYDAAIQGVGARYAAIDAANKRSEAERGVQKRGQDLTNTRGIEAADQHQNTEILNTLRGTPQFKKFQPTQQLGLSNAIMRLKPKYSAPIAAGLVKYGYDRVRQNLDAIAKGAKDPDGVFDQKSAQNALTQLGG